MFVDRCSSGSTSNPYGSTVTTMTSAFSSVLSPAMARRTASPVVVGPTPIRVSSSASSVLEKQSSTAGRSSPLYPWLKSENKDLISTEQRERTEHESEKTMYRTKNELQSRSPPRLAKHFTVQALSGDRSETLRPNPLGALSSTRPHNHMESRPSQTRSFFDNPLIPLNNLEKRPFDYGRSVGSIDLNRNTLYPRFDPMMSVHSPHVTSLTPPIGYIYPGAPFVADSMYHPSLGQGMFLGSRDPIPSFGRGQDMPFYLRREGFDDRMSER